jgi:SAM-dependent methyltransferase
LLATIDVETNRDRGLEAAGAEGRCATTTHADTRSGAGDCLRERDSQASRDGKSGASIRTGATAIRSDWNPLGWIRLKAKIARDAGRRALVVDEVVQSVVVPTDAFGPGVWPMLLPDQAPRRSLILGVGGGTVIHLLTRRFGPHPIVGVEIDPQVIALARSHFGLDLPHLEVVVADAFEFVPALAGTPDPLSSERETFDYILVDLFVGGQIARDALRRPFLRHLRALLSQDGTIVYNFFHDRRLGSRLHRLGQILTVARSTEVDLNVVVHCRHPGQPTRLP